MMKAKGSVIKSISVFVQKKYPNQYKSWLNGLPPVSKKIYTDAILATEWYPMSDGVIIPTELISKMFYSNEKKAAWDSGYFSAEYSLNGVYKVFVLISKPSYLMARSSKLLPSFYAPTEVSLVESTGKSMTVHITKFPVPNEILEHRIAGWMFKALEICGCKNLKVDVTKSMAKRDPVTEFSILWK